MQGAAYRPMKIGKIEITGGFLVLVAFLNYIDGQGVVFPALLACFLHEAGHYIAIEVMGGSVKYIRITLVGAEMRLERSLSYGREMLAALAGPGINLVLALIFSRWNWGMLFAGVNLALAAFNLLPAGKLDGGRILNCIVSLLFGPEWATRAGRGFDRLLRCVLLVLSCWLVRENGNFTLLIVSVWLLLHRGEDEPPRRIRIKRRGRRKYADFPLF